MSTPQVSIILATHNRRAVVAQTLTHLRELELPRDQYEIIVTDNASTDGTRELLADQRDVRLVALRENVGSCAKAYGVELARGAVTVFLDDDSYPRRGSLTRLQRHFAAEPGLGAAGFLVHLPDGSQECSALPDVFVGCGVGLRTSALRAVGGLDRSFFMQAEEYDLTFRMLAAGWETRVFGDLHVEHLKTPQARRSERTTYYDARNNLRVIARYLPDDYVAVYTADLVQRYRWLAEQAGHGAAFERGAVDGQRQGWFERPRYRQLRLREPVLERVFAWGRVERRMQALYDSGVRRIGLVDLGKNVYAFYRAARAARLDIVALADDRLAAPERTYRDVPLVGTEALLAGNVEGLVISNTSYVHAARRALELQGKTPRPIHLWFPSPEVVSAPTLAATAPPRELLTPCQ